MALTQDESATLMNDFTFRGRVKVCIITYAQYLREQTASPLRGSQATWCAQAQGQPDAMAAQLTPLVVLNPNVQAAGGAVTDIDLQAATQAVVDEMV